jgi:dTDP-4-dehydrorhamnose reductase
MSVLVLGASGMLGTDLCAELVSRGFDVGAPSLKEVDITDPSSLAGYLSADGAPTFQTCINCAAYTAVDLAETERDEAYRINALGAGYVAQTCAIAQIKLVHISTDFVFDGSASDPYREDASPNPLGVYGASKLEGERSALSAAGTVVRTSWLYGIHGKSFPRTILNAYRSGRELRVVSDQVGCPTSTVDLSRVLADMVSLPLGPPPGVFHAVGPEPMSWHGFAQLVVKADGGDTSVVQPIKTEDWPTPASRPAYSVLSTAKLEALGISRMRTTAESLREFIRNCS